MPARTASTPLVLAVTAWLAVSASPVTAQDNLGFDDNQDALESFDEEIDQTFDAFDQEVEARFRAMDRAISRAFAEMERKIARRWGDAAKMPSDKVWVGYTEALDSRVVADYAQGEIRLEHLGDLDPAELRARLERVLEADSDALNQRDAVAERVAERAEQAGGDAAADAEPADTGAAPEQNRELGRLADDTAEPEIERDVVQGDDGEQRAVSSISVPMLDGHERLSAERVEPVVEKFARRYDVPEPLVLAVIKNESAFNPRAQSPEPAFGLMQLVPDTGGRDAYRFVRKKDKAPSPELLFQPNANMRLGTAYLHILMQRYLSPIENPTSRLYCAIAAYNTGAGNVARTFTDGTSVEAAARRINRMSPEAVYEHLVDHLPYAETRTYLQRVESDRRAFRKRQQG